jgi:hypothetical protein
MKPSNTILRHATTRRILVAIGLPLTGLVVFTLSRPQPKAAAPVSGITAPATAIATSSAGAEAFRHVWQWPENSGATYRIHQVLDLAPGNADLAPDSCGQTAIDGKLNVRLVESDPTSVSLAVQLSDTTVTVDPAGETPPHRETIIEQMLNTTAGVLEMDRDGRVLACRLPAAIPQKDRIMLQGLLSIEFVMGQGSRWESDEKLQGAACRAFYQANGTEPVSKRRQALPTPEGQPAMHIHESAFTAVPGPFWIESLNGGEQLEYVWDNQRVCLAKTTVAIKRQDQQDPAPHALAALMADPAKREALIDGASLTSHDDTERESARERQHLARLVEQYGPIPASRMIDDLIQAVAGTEEHSATIPAMHALRDWLLANPTRSGELAEALKNPNLPDGVTARIAHALELAGQKSKESQATLASIIASAPGTFPPAVLLQAAVAAGGLNEVLAPDLVTALCRMASAEDPGTDYRLSDAALFSLGSLARNNPELGDHLIKTLSPWLESNGATSTEDQATALRALGNAAINVDAIMAKALSLNADHNDLQIRMATIDFFSSSTRPEAIQAMSHSLTSDPSDDVRLLALNALTRPDFISSDRVRPVLDLLRKPGTSETIQETAIANLASFQDDFPEIRETFRKLLPQARGKAAAMLSTSLTGNP